MSDTDVHVVLAGELSGNDSLEIEPGRWWEISSVSPHPESSGGIEMVDVELLPSEQGAAVLILPATMPLRVQSR